VKISIVTISYNQAKYIKQCIDSVLIQHCDGLEYIIVDAGSTDGSREIIESYGDRVIKVFAKDQGPADGLNKGFKLATGDIYGFLNSDDMLLPGTLHYVLNIFEQKEGIDVVHGNGYQIDEENRIIKKLYSTKFSAKRYAYDAVNIVQQATFFRKEIFLQVNGFNIKNKWCWDGELFVRMAINQAIFYKVNKFLGGFRVYPESISGGAGDYEGYLFNNNNLKKEILASSPQAFTGLFTAYYKMLKLLFNPRYAFSLLRQVYYGRK
jgi:glycosyltransferase involved in cell wall biosynthesis